MTSFDHTHPAHHHEFSAGIAEHLDREAILAQNATSLGLDRAVAALEHPVRTVLDLGSGTGAGTIALAQRFPHAQVHCLDLSAELMDRLANAVTVAGVADRVHTHVADLDGDWTSVVPQDVDLVWASLSLHHVAGPAQVLQRALSVLRPGGVLVVTEISGSTVFTPDDLGTGRHGLADRFSEGVIELDHLSVTDWRGLLVEAGFAPAQRELTDVTAPGDTAEGAAYLASRMSAWRDSIAHRMSAEDLVALDAAQHEIEAGSSPVSATFGRTVWVAARPDEGIGAVTTPAAERVDAEAVVVGGGAAGLAAAIALRCDRPTSRSTSTAERFVFTPAMSSWRRV